MRERWPVWLLVLSYCLTLPLPALSLGDSFLYGETATSPVSVHRFTGFEILFMSGFTMFFPPWWANALFLVGTGALILRRPRRAYYCGLAAMALAAATVPMMGGEIREWYRGFQPFPLQIGYLIWLSCMLLLAGLGRNAFQRCIALSSEVAGVEV